MLLFQDLYFQRMFQHKFNIYRIFQDYLIFITYFSMHCNILFIEYFYRINLLFKNFNIQKYFHQRDLILLKFRFDNFKRVFIKEIDRSA